MSRIDSLPEAHVQTLAKVLGVCGTGSEISRVLRDRQLEDKSGESTKWKRLYWVFMNTQRTYGCANRMLDFIRAFLAPGRFVGRTELFEEHRNALNEVLSLSGLEFRADGEFARQKVARTLDEAERRVKTIRTKFRGRQIHPEVLKYCEAELMQDNYFHAIFEATKGLAQRIRDLSNCQGDGAALVEHVFAMDQPILAFKRIEDGHREVGTQGHRRIAEGLLCGGSQSTGARTQDTLPALHGPGAERYAPVRTVQLSESNGLPSFDFKSMCASRHARLVPYDCRRDLPKPHARSSVSSVRGLSEPAYGATITPRSSAKRSECQGDR